MENVAIGGGKSFSIAERSYDEGDVGEGWEKEFVLDAIDVDEFRELCGGGGLGKERAEEEVPRE